MSVPTPKTRWYNSTRAHDTVLAVSPIRAECVLIGGVGKYNAKSPFDPKRHCARPPAPTHPNAQPRHERHVQQRPHGLHLHCERTTSDVPHKRRGTSVQPPKRPIGRDEVAAAVRERPDHGPDRLRRPGTCTGWWGRCGIFLEVRGGAVAGSAWAAHGQRGGLGGAHLGPRRRACRSGRSSEPGCEAGTHPRDGQGRALSSARPLGPPRQAQNAPKTRIA